VIIQTCSAEPTVEGTECVRATNGCNVRCEERNIEGTEIRGRRHK